MFLGIAKGRFARRSSSDILQVRHVAMCSSDAHTDVVMRRWPLYGRHGRLRAADGDEEQLVRHSYCSPRRGLLDAGMLLLSARRALPQTLAFAPLLTSTAHPHHSDVTRHAAGFPSGHPTIRPAHGMGWLDRARGYYPHHRIHGGYLCNAPHFGQQEGEEEEDRRECGYERGELL